MVTTLQIPRVLRSRCGGKAELRLQGSTVRAALKQLKQAHPSLYESICDETGSVRQHLNLFVNNDWLRDRNGLDTQLKPGDVLSVFQAVSGG